jgi:hypothetical protein
MAMNFADEVSLSYSAGILTCRKTLHGAEGFTSPPKEVVLLILLSLTIHRLRPGLIPRTFGPMASH